MTSNVTFLTFPPNFPSSHPSHKLYLYSSRSSSDSFYTKFGSRKPVHTIFHTFFPPYNIFDIFNPAQTSLHINSFSLTLLFHFSLLPFLTLPLPDLSLHFALPLSSRYLRSSSRNVSAMSCPWFCTIAFPFSSRSTVLLSQSLFLSFYVVLFATPPPINIISSHSFPRTDPSHFTIFTKFRFTSNSFPLRHLFARCLVSSFFVSLDILSLSLSLRCHVRGPAPSPVFPAPSFSFHLSTILSFPTILLSITPFRSLNASRSKLSFYVRYLDLGSMPSFSNSYFRLIVLSFFLLCLSFSRPEGRVGGVRVFSPPSMTVLHQGFSARQRHPPVGTQSH